VPADRAAWALTQRVALTNGEIAFDVLGRGPAVVLVHGTPTSSFLWRKIAPKLAEHFTVYVFDMLGFGDSEREVEQHVSIAVHAANLVELVEHWGISSPAVVGHDIGGGTILRAHLVHDMPVASLTLIDAVVLRPWITPHTQHIRAHLDAFVTMPHTTWWAMTEGHLRRAVHREMAPEAFEGHFGQWRGPRGQALWLRNLRQFDEDHTREFEARLSEIDVPTLLLWGENDNWLDVKISEQLEQRIPGARRIVIEEAGHFAMEDQPQLVAHLLDEFLSDGFARP